MAALFDTGAFSIDEGHSWHKEESFLFDPSQYNVTQLFKEVNIDFQYYMTSYKIKTPSGEYINSNKETILRSPTEWDNEWREIRSNVANTNVLNPLELAAALDQLTDVYPLTGAMSLKKGGIVIATMRMNPFLVGNHPTEEYKMYFNVAQDLTRPLSVIFAESPVRVVCRNTYKLMLSQKDGIVRIPHSTKDMATIISVMASNEKALVLHREQEIKFLNSLFVSKKVNEENITDLVAELFPAPKKSWATKLYEQTQELMTKLTDHELEVLEENAERSNEIFLTQFDSITRTRAAVELRAKELRTENDHGSMAYWLFQSATEILNHGYKDLVSIRGDYLQKHIALNVGTKAQALASTRKKFEKVAH